MEFVRQVTVRRGGSPTTRWTAALGAAAPALAGLVGGYGEFVEWSASPVRRREVPGPATVLVVELAEPLHARGAVDRELVVVHAFVGAPGRGPALTWHGGRLPADRVAPGAEH